MNQSYNIISSLRNKLERGGDFTRVYYIIYNFIIENNKKSLTNKEIIKELLAITGNMDYNPSRVQQQTNQLILAGIIEKKRTDGQKEIRIYIPQKAIELGYFSQVLFKLAKQKIGIKDE